MAYYNNRQGYNANAETAGYSYYYRDDAQDNNKQSTAVAAPATGPNPYRARSEDHVVDPLRQTVDTFDYAHFKKREGQFTFYLFTRCQHGWGFCCQGYACYYCNLARQCSIDGGDNFTQGSSATLALGLCVADWFVGGFLCMPFCCGGIPSWAVLCCTREKVRRRFGIQGNPCNDCVAAVCCGWCAVQQMLGEFVVWGYNPPTGCNTYGEQSSYPTPMIKTEMA